MFNSPTLVLWGPFVMLLLCAFGFPMPEDIILVTAGYLSARAHTSFWLTAGVTYAGILIGDGFIFFAGRMLGGKILKTKIGSWILSPESLEKVKVYFDKYGSGVVFVGRFLPGLRTAVFFSSGTLRYPVWKFFFMDGFAALISAPLFVWVGHWAYLKFSEDFDHLERLVGKTKIYLVAAVAVVAIIIFIRLYLKNKKTQVTIKQSLK